jgi:Terpene synthase family 2, C-terminal metal binding
MGFSVDSADLLAVGEAGRICAAATAAARDLRAWASGYGDFFVSSAFGPSTLTFAFASPWLSADDLRVSNRVCAWDIAVDRQIDCYATSHDEIVEIINRCEAISRGDTPAPNDLLARSLADIRDELIRSRLWPHLGQLWADTLSNTLQAELREWDAAKAFNGATLPTMKEYIEDADNFQSRFINIAHWIVTEAEEAEILAHLDVLLEALAARQIALRLANDLCGHEREKSYADLNAFVIGADADLIASTLAEYRDRCHDLLRPLVSASIRPAIALLRSMEFALHFYEVLDYHE